MGAISSLIRGKNFKGKRLFATEMNGLHFIEYLIKDDDISMKLKTKALILMYDLIINDEASFLNDPTYIRYSLTKELNITIPLFKLLD